MAKNKIKCICVDDKNKPAQIPTNKWIKEGETYHVTHIYFMRNMSAENGFVVQGCDILEHDISGPQYKPYNCYRLTRFAFNPEDFEDLIAMMNFCAEMNGLKDIDVNKLVETLTEELITHE